MSVPAPPPSDVQRLATWFATVSAVDARADARWTKLSGYSDSSPDVHRAGLVTAVYGAFAELDAIEGQILQESTGGAGKTGIDPGTYIPKILAAQGTRVNTVKELDEIRRELGEDADAVARVVDNVMRLARRREGFLLDEPPGQTMRSIIASAMAAGEDCLVEGWVPGDRLRENDVRIREALVVQCMFVYKEAVRTQDAVERTRASFDRIEALFDKLGERVRATYDVLAQAVASEQLRTSRVEAATAQRFQDAVTLVAAVLVAPGLVAAVYGANSTPFASGSGSSIYSLLCVMLASVVGALSLLRMMQSDDNISRAEGLGFGAAGAILLGLGLAVVLLLHVEDDVSEVGGTALLASFAVTALTLGLRIVRAGKHAADAQPAPADATAGGRPAATSGSSSAGHDDPPS